ncbi:hypothetical protein BDQ12DRAFT_730786 [Crucibulum laeve]|uniref:Csf1 N-terminal domain-containing protein n=1 Tax=Crucibulum laeve TaxID=68775 RepID=A0A5C3MHB2_9AGAR|nr:hypothetical protein BDQ12DRAFT_730786 [Crucibulum laeve]
MLDRLLPVACSLIIAALIAYFFFWNRFIAFLIGVVIRVLYWNQGSSSIWVELGSIHFSILAGRILVKDFCYHSSNQTVKIVKGQLQWRYWIRRPTTETDISGSVHPDDDKQTKRSLSCRIQISLQGFEWFLYNRTAAYDSIISQMESSSRPTSRTSGAHRSSQRLGRRDTTSPFYPPSRVKRTLTIPMTIQTAMAYLKRQLPNLDPKDLLPLGLEATKGAIICGNASAPSLLVAEFQSADGTFGIVQSKSKNDLYKQVLAMKFQNASFRLVENEDYVDPMTAIGEVVHSRVEQYSTLAKASSYLSYRSFTRLCRQIKLYTLTTKYSTTRREQRTAHQNITTAAGLLKKARKAVDEDTPIGADFSQLEYAIERKILEAPIFELSYYVDVVGEVPEDPEDIGLETIDIGNGDVAPEWGIEMIVRGGLLRYGPWADRQRAELQKAFFPPTYQNAEITPQLSPGDKRVWTALYVFIELRDETTLHIPFREASKDWQWDGLVKIPSRPRKREGASINMTVSDRSSIKYIMPMVANSEGYESTLEAHLDTIAITSSLNDMRLVSAESCRVQCELPSPIKWNGERTWNIAVSLRQPILFLLRDHINMFTDLGKDWASGPPTEWQRFVPTIYAVKMELHHFEMSLYANDQNIIDKPQIKDENALAVIRGSHLRNDIKIPSNIFRPESANVTFSGTAPDLSIDFSLPRWNTYALHAPKDGHSVAKTGYLGFEGSYRYFSETREEHIDQFKLNFKLRNTAFKALGWSIRYFMVLRDNYLGSFTHFSTLYEYLDKRKRGIPVGDPISSKYREGKSNMMQTEMSVNVEQGTIIMPASLVGYEAPNADQRKQSSLRTGACVIFSVPELQLQLRMHDYYMEMSLNIDTARGHIELDYPERVTYSRSKRCVPKEIFMIDGVDITANRLFGPQPRTATYVCVWEISVGHVKTILNALDGQLLTMAGDSFRLGFVDPANAPANEYQPSIDLDVTFYKIRIAAVDLTWQPGNAALLLSLPCGLNFDSNDLGTQYYRKVISINVPRAVVRVLLSASSERNWLEAAEVVADAFLDIYSAPLGHHGITRAQMAFIEGQDILTGRARRIFDALLQRGHLKGHASHKNSLYLPQTTLPERVRSARPNLQRQPKARRVSEVANLSESDGEEGVSEADRDARLARTRSMTPLPLFRDAGDLTMSSGDESDDADLTSGESSDSNWSDIVDPSDAILNSSLFNYYSRLTRHYGISRVGQPSLWEGPPFVLLQDRTHRGTSQSRFKRDNAKDSARHPPRVVDDLGSGKDNTIFRFHTRKSIEIKVTPLILPAVTYFEVDITNIKLDPALTLDTLIGGYLSGSSSRKAVGSCITFDATLPSATIQISQHIPLSEEGYPAIPRHQKDINVPSNLDITAVIQGEFHAIRVTGVLLQQRLATINASLDHFYVNLDIPANKHTTLSVPPEAAILDLHLADLWLNVSPGAVKLGGDIDTKLGHRGPELASATAVAFAKNATSLASTVKKSNDHKIGRIRRIVHQIIHSSSHRPILDPLSTIQPSYLIQSGTPRELRTNATFRFLFHLRNCLWNLENAERNTLYSIDDTVNEISLESFTSSLGSRLAILDPDAYNITRLYSLDSLFPDLRSKVFKPSKSRPSVVGSISVHIGKFHITVLEPMGGSSSRFTIIDLQVTALTRTLELIQPISNLPNSLSQTSLRNKGTRNVTKSSVSISIRETTLTVFPHLMHFAEHILRVFSHYNVQTPPFVRPAEAADMPSTSISSIRDLSITFFLGHLRLQAAAENLVFEVGASGIRTSSCILNSQGHGSRSVNYSILFDAMYLEARTPADLTERNDQDVLAALTLKSGKLSAVSRQETTSTNHLRLVFSLDDIHLNVPRSALRLYHFVGEWRADFLPGIEATMKTLLSQFQAVQSKPVSPTPSRTIKRRLVLQIHGQLGRFEVSLQVMHGTWLTLEGNNIIGHMQTPNTTAPSKAFGLQVASMVFNVSSKPDIDDVAPSSRIRLALPALSIAGRYDGSLVHTLVLVEFIEMKVKTSHWDTLLAVQQKFGQDFNDLVTLMQKSRLKRSTPQKSASPKTFVRYGGFLKMRGFCIGLEGLSSTIYLECSDIAGGMNNEAGWAWDLGLSDLALSLSPRSVGRVSSRQHRSAFVTIDFKMSAKGSDIQEASHNIVQLVVSRIHAVMQPSSIGEVGDFIDHLQAEILDRKDQRAMELAAFKEKTQSILKTFDVKVGESQLDETSSWLKDYVVKVSIHGIGVAFPLIHDEELELPQIRNRDSVAVRAFLFSIKSIDFATHRGETGQAMMQNFSFIFTSRFRQSVSSDFAAENHQTRNRLVYPEMTAQLRTSKSANSRQIWLGANVSGFILDLDSTIPDYVFSLVDVYRQGKDRVERLSSSVPRTPSSATPSVESAKKPMEKYYTAIPTSNVFGSLTFSSGKVRVYSGSATTLFRSRSVSNSVQELSDEQVLSLGAEVFNLPVVSVWAEYRATPASQKHTIGNEQEPSILMFKSTVHSSQNTLRPKLLPFVTELVSHVEARMRKISSQTSRPPSLAVSHVPSVVTSRRDENVDAVSSMRISFSLRIDQSKLELTCQPDVNVIAGLHWDSGGFIVNVSPGARKVSFTGSVAGLRIGLKHGFLSEDCVRLDARNLSFSVSFAKVESNDGIALSSISVVLDTEFHGAVRFSRLQDILCFKAVWLDRIPIFNAQSFPEPKTPGKLSISTPTESQLPHTGKQGLSTVILVRIRQITLDVDLGQSISAITLDLKQAVMRTKLTEASNELSIQVGEVEILARGNLSGHARVPNCVFQTIRRKDTDSLYTLYSSGECRMLELRLTSGALVVSLESDHQEILHYRAEPLEVEICDDWSKAVSGRDSADRLLHLAFTVTSPEILAVVTVGTIPRVQSYINKFKANLDAQRAGASRESQTFRSTRSPKPENPLSAVAEAMLQSARSRFKEAEPTLSYIIRQKMSLKLELLRLVVFPRTMDDSEIAQFIGQDVQAQLDRLVTSETQPAKRDLHLSFASMSISKFTRPGHSAIHASKTWDRFDSGEWLAAFLKDAVEAIIVGLPSMKMHMVSEEMEEDLATNLIYDFHSEFVRREGMKAFEDIYITLNVSLYSWLTILRKNLTREMDQVRATEDWRTSLPASATAQKKKIPEPLSLSPSVDAQKSMTYPSPSNYGVSSPLIPAPLSANYPLIEQTRSATVLHPPTSAGLPSTRDLSQSPTLHSTSAVPFPSAKISEDDILPAPVPKRLISGVVYKPRNRHIERLTMRQLGEATPDVMHPFFMKKAGFNLEDSLPQYVNEYATVPLEEIMEVLLKLYSRQLLAGNKKQ